MPRWANVTIGTVDLTTCKVQITDPQAFASDYTGNHVIAADGQTVYTQLLNTGDKARTFGFSIEWCPITLYTALKAQFEASLASNVTINAVLSDGADSINVQVKPDLPTYLTRGVISGDFVRNVQIKLISA